jgi:hypothetical protein
VYREMPDLFNTETVDKGYPDQYTPTRDTAY